MAQRRKSGPVMHLVSITAAAATVVLAVNALAPAQQRDTIATAQQLEDPANGIPLRPSYVVRIPPPVVAPPAKPTRALVSLSVQPVAPAVENTGPAAETWYVTAGALNVRAGPSSGSRQLAALPMGTAVEVLDDDGSWVEVTTADGVTGWVFAKYLSQTAP